MDISTVTVLPLQDLHIDETYHTTINAEALGSLCGDLNPHALGLLLVNQRPDGTFWVVDGATRLLAMHVHGLEQAAVELVEGWTVAQEREAYTIRNTTVPKHAMDLYKARLVASGITAP